VDGLLDLSGEPTPYDEKWPVAINAPIYAGLGGYAQGPVLPLLRLLEYGPADAAHFVALDLARPRRPDHAGFTTRATLAELFVNGKSQGR
jgi:hypothetical protein